ncbi:MAG: signal recognition particle-docking protein FtsY [Actinomycetota bacterium]
MTGILIAIAVVGVLAIVGGVLLSARRTRAPGARPSVERRAPAERPVTTRPSAPARPGVRERLSKSRRFLSDHLTTVFGHPVDDETWDDLEAALIQSDVGVEVAQRVTEDLRAKARDARISSPEEARALMADELLTMFDPNLDRGLNLAPDGVTVWLIVGVNGSGKTTTIGKLASDARERGRSVSLAAADTFRAAADEQLGIWAERTGASIVKHQPGADPGAVAFDALQHARAKSIDVLIVDTAGRLHTKTPLMDELSKIRRVIEKENEVSEALLTLDATAGQNALVQAREFASAAGVTGVVLTKLDGTAKGGIAIAVEQTLGIPIKLVGLGEDVDDLEPFDPKVFIDALLS